MMTQAIKDACRVHQVNQGELADKIGCTRETLLLSRSVKINHDGMPRRIMGVDKCVELARLAGWTAWSRWDMAVAWTEETLIRSEHAHWETLKLLRRADREARMDELVENRTGISKPQGNKKSPGT